MSIWVVKEDVQRYERLPELHREPELNPLEALKTQGVPKNVIVYHHVLVILPNKDIKHGEFRDRHTTYPVFLPAKMVNWKMPDFV